MAGVVLATAGYDHTIRFWEAASGTCNRTVKYPDSVRRWACGCGAQRPAGARDTCRCIMLTGYAIM